MPRNVLQNYIPWEELSVTRVYLASDGVEAVEQARRYRPELIISDIKMPYLNGLEMAAAVREFLPDCQFHQICGGYRQEQGGKGMKKKGHPFWEDLKKNRTKWLMILPAAVVVILMCYIPMAGIVLAFKEFNYHDGIFGSPWAGFKNFEYFFQSGKAWTTTRNTILYNAIPRS